MTTEIFCHYYDNMKDNMVVVTTSGESLTGLWKTVQINTENASCRMILEIEGVTLTIPASSIIEIKLVSQK